MEPAKQCTSLIWFVYYQLYHLLFYYRTPSMQILKWSTVKFGRLRFFVSLYEFRILNYCEKSGCVMPLGITVAINFRLYIFNWFSSVQKLYLVSHPPLLLVYQDSSITKLEFIRKRRSCLRRYRKHFSRQLTVIVWVVGEVMSTLCKFSISFFFCPTHFFVFSVYFLNITFLMILLQNTNWD